LKASGYMMNLRDALKQAEFVYFQTMDWLIFLIFL